MRSDDMLAIQCPKCGQESQQSLVRLQKDPSFDCPACGAPLTANLDEFNRVLRKAEKRTEKLLGDAAKTITLKLKL